MSPYAQRGGAPRGFSTVSILTAIHAAFLWGQPHFLGEMITESPVRLQLRTERRDQVFARPDQPIGGFTFNAKVADVFDDMVSRSVPYYEEMQRMVCELAQDFAVPNTNLYDIGCSTATTLLTLDRMIDPNVNFTPSTMPLTCWKRRHRKSSMQTRGARST